MEFIELAIYKKENPNVDPSEYQVVTVNRKGKDLEGVWVSLQKEGHHKLKKYEGKLTEKDRCVDDGTISHPLMT